MESFDLFDFDFFRQKQLPSPSTLVPEYLETLAKVALGEDEDLDNSFYEGDNDSLEYRSGYAKALLESIGDNREYTPEIILKGTCYFDMGYLDALGDIEDLRRSDGSTTT